MDKQASWAKREAELLHAAAGLKNELSAAQVRSCTQGWEGAETWGAGGFMGLVERALVGQEGANWQQAG